MGQLREVRDPAVEEDPAHAGFHRVPRHALEAFTRDRLHDDGAGPVLRTRMDGLEQLLDLDDPVVLGERDLDLEAVSRRGLRCIRGLKSLELLSVGQQRHQHAGLRHFLGRIVTPWPSDRELVAERVRDRRLLALRRTCCWLAK